MPIEGTGPILCFNGLSVEDFLAEYWQQKPLLIRDAFPSFHSPVQADEIAGFAIDDDVEARLVIQKENRVDQWQVFHSPLPENQFANLPDSHWALLVQQANLLDPGINALLAPFRFIPNWRLDDIMVSYAVDGGGVGPHYDHYDVFLLQGDGQRLWRLGQQCDSNSALIPGQPMKILADFRPSDEFILNPGDVLYIPPQVAHWGIAIGESITYSIGFRAPSHADLLLDLSQELASNLREDYRYTDPKLPLQSHPGEIRPEVLKEMISIVQHITDNPPAIADWLGIYSTTNHRYQPLESITLSEDTAFCLDPFARNAFIAGTNTNDEARLFVNGHRFLCSLAMAIAITEHSQLTFGRMAINDKNVASHLATLGLLKIID